MTKFITTVVIFISLAVSQTVHAGLISFDIKSLRGESLTNDLHASWLSNSNEIRSRELDNFEQVDIGRHSIAHLSISFDLATQSTWSFDFGLDAGYGAELFVDGNLVVDRTDDLWWRRNWQHSDVFSLTAYDFTKGSHTLDVYFAENCCDGLSTVRMTNHSTQEISMLTSSALQAASIPEPATAILFGLGALGLLLRRNA